MKTLKEILTTYFETYSLLGEYATDKDTLEEIELNDIAHERADSDENVIYYGKAHALIRNAPSSDVEEAEQMMYDCGGCEGKSYNEIATLIAFWVVNNETMEDLQRDVENPIEHL